MTDRKPKRKHGLQWNMDQELQEQEHKVINNFNTESRGGGEGSTPNNYKRGTISMELLPSSSPLIPPSPSQVASEEGELSTIVKEIMSTFGARACLYEDPVTRETIRRKLQGLGVTNINQLIRTYPAADLVEAISDFERARRNGMVVRSPMGYFRSLLK